MRWLLLFIAAAFCLPLLWIGREDTGKDREEDPDRLPRVVISQKVPSVFEALRGKRK